MMGRQSGQMSMLILDIEELIPGNHLLRQINQLVSFDFIYVNTPPETVPLDRTNGALRPLKWCMVTAVMVH